MRVKRCLYPLINYFFCTPVRASRHQTVYSDKTCKHFENFLNFCAIVYYSSIQYFDRKIHSAWLPFHARVVCIIYFSTGMVNNQLYKSYPDTLLDCWAKHGEIFTGRYCSVNLIILLNLQCYVKKQNRLGVDYFLCQCLSKLL